MKNEFVEIAVANLQKNARINAKWKKHISQEIDGKLEIQAGNKIIMLNAILRDEINEEDLNEIYKLAVKYVQFVVITKTISPKTKEFLRQVHVSHLEKNGNFFLEQKNIFILIEKNHTETEDGLSQKNLLQNLG